MMKICEEKVLAREKADEVKHSSAQQSGTEIWNLQIRCLELSAFTQQQATKFSDPSGSSSSCSTPRQILSAAHVN